MRFRTFLGLDVLPRRVLALALILVIVGCSTQDLATAKSASSKAASSALAVVAAYEANQATFEAVQGAVSGIAPDSPAVADVLNATKAGAAFLKQNPALVGAVKSGLAYVAQQGANP